jgi:hypothetical protein
MVIMKRSIADIVITSKDSTAIIKRYMAVATGNGTKCHNLLGYIAADTSGCRRGVYCNCKHGFLIAVIDRRDKNSIN